MRGCAGRSKTRVKLTLTRASRASENCVFKGNMVRPARFERATLCLEGRRSIQLSYGRVGYCNCITELKAFVEWALQSHFHCAQFCAHLAETWQQKQHPRTGGRIGRRSRWNFVMDLHGTYGFPDLVHERPPHSPPCSTHYGHCGANRKRRLGATIASTH
jgi:hypothetical protein